MYDINSWKDCLSFIQLSVAFNFGCAILSNNPVIGLFKTLIKKSNQKATDYVQSFAPKLEKCLQYESKFNFEEYVDFAVENTKSIDISVDSDLELPLLGLEVRNTI